MGAYPIGLRVVRSVFPSSGPVVADPDMIPRKPRQVVARSALKIIAQVTGVMQDIREQSGCSSTVFIRLSSEFHPMSARLQRVPSIAAAASSLNSSAICNAPLIHTSSSSRAAICPAGSLRPRAASRLR